MPEECWFERYLNNFANNLNLLSDYGRNIAPEEDRYFDQRLK